MSLEDIYDADCHLIKPPDIWDLIMSIQLEKEKKDLIKSINKTHFELDEENQYSIEILRKLDKLLNEDIIDFECDDSNYISAIGFYYELKDDYESAEKYYLMAIEKNCSVDSIYRLGSYYENGDVADYDKMKKYYLMAIEKGHIRAMYSLGEYYERIEDYNNMKKYYLMAIEKGNVYAMFLLGFYYENKNLCVIQDEKNKIELIENENLAIKYMLMTIENGKDNDKMQIGDAAMSLGCIYGERKDKENMRKYFSLCEAITPDEQKRKEAKQERQLYERKY